MTSVVERSSRPNGKRQPVGSPDPSRGGVGRALLTTLAAAWVILWLVPTLVGSPLGTITLFQPDLGTAMIATSVTGVLWALFRLAAAYTGRSRPVRGAPLSTR